MTAKTADTLLDNEEPTDIETIMPDTRRVLDIDGVNCKLRRLKTREFFSFMRILLRGFGGGLVGLMQEEDEEKMVGRLVGAMLVAIPEAEDEFIVFLKRMIEPIDPTKKNVEKVMEVLSNPELDVLLDIGETIAEQEASELTRLGKAARAWWKTAGPTLKKQATDG